MTDPMTFMRQQCGESLSEATAAKYSKPNVYRGVLARFPRAIKELARVSEFGTRKHQVPLDDMSFADIPEAEVMYKEALTRHLLDEAIEGPINEKDGGLLHCLQRAWDALADAEVYLKRQEEMEGAYLIRPLTFKEEEAVRQSAEDWWGTTKQDKGDKEDTYR